MASVLVTQRRGSVGQPCTRRAGCGASKPPQRRAVMRTTSSVVAENASVGAVVEGEGDDEEWATTSRRSAWLGIVASVSGTAALMPRMAHAETAGAAQYCRSFRDRFETSISASTRDYCFNYPSSGWKNEIVSLNDGKVRQVRTGSV